MDAPSRAEKASLASQEQSNLQEFCQSLTDGLTSPVKSCVQIYDDLTGSRHKFAKQHHSAPAETWSTRWMAQEAGTIVGTLPWILAAHRIAGGATRISAEVGLLPQFAMTSAERLAITRSAFTGMAMGTLFTPTESQAGNRNFWSERLLNGTSTAIQFSAMTGLTSKAESYLAPGLKGLAKALPEGSRLSSIVGSERLLHSLSGAATGLPAGLIGAETNSLLTKGRFASYDELSRTAASMTFNGSIMGGFQQLEPMHVDQNFVKRGAVIERTDGTQKTIDTARYYLEPGDQLAKASPYFRVGSFEFYRAHDMRMLEKRSESLAKHALEDGLTHLPNNRAGQLALEREFARAQRNSSPLSIVFFDLDGFKAVNDKLSHDAGDLALKSASSSLKGRLRQSDCLFRKGGDEFVAILPDTNGAGAKALTDDIQATTRLSFENDAGTVKCEVGVSAGIVTYDPLLNSEITSVSEILKQADGLMYENKAARKAAERARLAADQTTNRPSIDRNNSELGIVTGVR
jgi:diguanylate cyclase (GGDEF)-like protein